MTESELKVKLAQNNVLRQKSRVAEAKANLDQGFLKLKAEMEREYFKLKCELEREQLLLDAEILNVELVELNPFTEQ